MDGNDASALLAQLREAAEAGGEPDEAAETDGPDASANPNAVVQLVSRIRGPWALVYWHAPTRNLWWGRDAIGRRRCDRERQPPPYLRALSSPSAAVSLLPPRHPTHRLDLYDSPCSAATDERRSLSVRCVCSCVTRSSTLAHSVRARHASRVSLHRRGGGCGENGAVC